MLATMKKVTIDEHNEDLVAFAQTIDFSELFNHAKTYAKVECEFHQPEVSTIRGDVHIRFMSHDIANQTGAFAAILERCYLGSFSNKVYKDKETGELKFWTQVNISYDHKNGGSNGMEVFTAWYSASEGWIFRNLGN